MHWSNEIGIQMKLAWRRQRLTRVGSGSTQSGRPFLPPPPPPADLILPAPCWQELSRWHQNKHILCSVWLQLSKTSVELSWNFITPTSTIEFPKLSNFPISILQTFRVWWWNNRVGCNWMTKLDPAGSVSGFKLIWSDRVQFSACCPELRRDDCC
jgi:hypothetical protein